MATKQDEQAQAELSASFGITGPSKDAANLLAYLKLARAADKIEVAAINAVDELRRAEEELRTMKPMAMLSDEKWEAAMDRWDAARKAWLHAKRDDATAKTEYEAARVARDIADRARFGD